MSRAPRESMPPEEEEELTEVLEFLSSSENKEQIKATIKTICTDPSFRKKQRRHSDQFQNISSNRLFQELEKNRKVKIAKKFLSSKESILSATEKWKNILILLFSDLKRNISHGSPEELYKALNLQYAGVSREDVGIDSDAGSDNKDADASIDNDVDEGVF
ncbi:hypothetical protein NEFER03_0812 [Nematocida sp. LUAm3]|nr:hypothetical protein NEFER03_0812 [Nematocida sp. LUAm3]KAI5174830.1 hypothetical protein NEFER02_0930 [Nematocida sp. LUAm2]KAI5177572.1 hypothetical protein NEFER01_0822 [Nematocida sp. LUAm1]